ncbi:MAG: response regulator [bacterium]|nr:response regulator [bacterium]
MPATLFVYGLAFFILGVVLLIYPMPQRGHPLASNLKLIAAFGILHGLNEWVDLLILVRLSEHGDLLHWIRLGLLPLSFAALLLFAAKTIARHRRNEPRLKYLTLLLFALWGLFTFSATDYFLMGEIWARYFLALPGTFLTAYALLLEEETLRGQVPRELTGYIGLSAGAFIFYGMFAGLVVPKADFFPAALVNTALFSESGGMPVQIFRTICAVTIAYGLTRVLAIFSMTPDGDRTRNSGVEPKNQERGKIEVQETKSPRETPVPSSKEEPVKGDPSDREKDSATDRPRFETMGQAREAGNDTQARDDRRHPKSTARTIKPETGDSEKKTSGEAKGKILVMDDQPSTLEVTRQILTRLGHRVEGAANGTEATQLYRQARHGGDPFDLVILDLAITDGPGGEETMKKLQAIDPAVRVIVSSSRVEDPTMSAFQSFGFTGKLQKPYNMAELSQAVSSALSQAS